MTSAQLYEHCARKGISVFHQKLDLNRSVSAEIDGACYIGIDERGMTEAEKKVHLAHEIGHCERLAFYDPFTPLETRSRCEHKANAWAIKKALPKERLENAISQGITELWQLAEHFELTEDFIRLAVWEYFDKEV